MTLPTFPNLAGQGWSVHKKPGFSTRVSAHSSGREVRVGLYAHALYEFEATFDGLDAAGGFPGLTANSLQTLMGFFLTCQGQLNSFLYVDPSDCSASVQTFGVGDGATTAFLLQRGIGGYYEPVSYALTYSAPTLVPNYAAGPGSAYIYASNNLLQYSEDMTQSAWSKGNISISSGVSDPFGGTTAQTLTATAATGFVDQAPSGAGSNYVGSIWVRRRTGTGAVYMDMPNGSWSAIALTSSWQLFSVSGAPNTGLAYFAVVIATSGDAVDVCRAHLEQSTLSTPGAYFKTGATAYFGGPSVTVGGVYVDPSAYTFTAPNTITFASAPASSAVIAWSGSYAFQCRFLDDQLDFENFMAGAWSVKSVKFRSIR